MSSHNPSLMNGVLMPPIYHMAWVLLGVLSRWLVKSGKRPHDIGIRDIRLLFHQRRIFPEGRPDLTNHR
jgi:hypothetical protein